jgi:hypothetical protein
MSPLVQRSLEIGRSDVSTLVCCLCMEAFRVGGRVSNSMEQMQLLTLLKGYGATRLAVEEFAL